MAEMTGGQALVQQLKREGIDTLFVLPGVQLNAAFDAFYDERDYFRIINCRHEQGTAYMADGYARVTGRVGTCFVVPGPGVLNTTAALSTAYACCSPVLCMTGQIDSGLIGLGRGALHEIKDQMQAMASVTKWQGRAMTPAEVPGIVHQAFGELRSGRPRPVEIEVPPNIFAMKGDVTLLDAAPEVAAEPDSDLIERAAELLGRAKSPVILAGGGIIRAKASEELQALAELLGAPVVMTSNGKGAISERHPLALNPRALPYLLPDADAILAVGTRFLLGPTLQWKEGEKSVIQLDADPEEIGRNQKPDVGIIADAKKGLAALRSAVERYNIERPSRREEMVGLKQELVEEGNLVQPQAEFALSIRAELPEDGVLVSESTQVGYWSNNYFPVYEPGTLLSHGYQGTLGSGFATAIGAQVGLPDRKVVSINGDGGFMYNVQELATIVKYKIPVTAIVFNDNAFGNVMRQQEAQFNGRVIASDVVNPDFMKLADAFGLTGRRTKDPAELRQALRASLAADEPTLIEVPVGKMEYFAGRALPSKRRS